MPDFKVKLTPAPALKVKVNPQVNGRIVGTNGLEATRSGNTWTVGPAFDELSEILTVAVADHDNTWFQVYQDNKPAPYGKMSFEVLLSHAAADAIGANLAAIAALTPTDSNFIVGNGTTWVAESDATVRTSLGLAIGTNVQAYHARLADIAGITYAQGDILYHNGSNIVKLAKGTNGQFLKIGATIPEWATVGGGGDLLAANNLSDVANAGTARTNLGLAIGTNVQAFDATLTSIAALGTAADRISYTTGVDTWAETPITAFGRSIIDDASEAAFKATVNLEIGTDVQAFHARLSDIAGITYAQGDIFYYNGSNIVKLAAGTSGHVLKTQGAGANPQWGAGGAGDMQASNNLSDLTNIVTARSSIYAAPFDALAFNGMQWNGAMEVSQEIGSTPLTGITATSRYIVDGFQVFTAGAAVITAEQSSTAPTGLQNSLKCTFTTADAALASTDYSAILHQIEGYRVARLGFGVAGAQSCSIGFWVRSSKTGTYHVALKNGGTNRAYVVAYTISVADTWEFKTATFTGDTSGTWLKTTGVGAILVWTMAAGSSFQTTANAWQAGNFFSVAGAANAGDTTNATFYIAGVIFLPGIELPVVDRIPLILRPFSQERELCRRYLQPLSEPVVGHGCAPGYVVSGTTQASFLYKCSPGMRDTPTILLSAASHFDVAHAAAFTTCTAVTFFAAGTTKESIRPIGDVASGLTAGQGCFLRVNSTSASLLANSRF